MSRDQGLGLLLAAAIHLLAIFAFRLSPPPAPLPLGSDPIQVELVAAAPKKAADLNPPAVKSTTAAASPPAEEAEPSQEKLEEPKLSTPPPIASPSPSAIQKTSKNPKAPTARNKPSKSRSKSPSSPLGHTRSGTMTGGGRGDIAPSYRNNPQPPYPEEARRLGQQGAVLLDVLVSSSGRAAKVTVVRSSGVRILDQAAAAAVRGWSFEPGKVAGVPAAGHVTVPVRFRLER